MDVTLKAVSRKKRRGSVIGYLRDMNKKERTLLEKPKQKYYGSLDGLRTISCFSIIAMHIAANTQYCLSGFLWERFIPSLTWLVYLFLMISGFGMCAGYLERFQRKEVDLEKFYKRRYFKIAPFFGVLIAIALILEPSVTNLYEGTLELTLLHGLLPNNEMNVLGVSWTLGVIFLFYLLFPGFTVLLKSKKRAWLALIISLWINYACENYFFGTYFVTESFTPRHSFLYCAPLFCIGGIVYLYREKIVVWCSRFRWVSLLVCLGVTTLYYIIPGEIGGQNLAFYKNAVLFSAWLSYAVGVNDHFLNNRIMHYFSGISMEMYLAQMVIFRVIEKVHLIYLFGKTGIGGWTSFLITFLLVIVGLVVFIEVFRYLQKKVICFLTKMH